MTLMIIITLFFLASFIFPIILGIIFTYKCFAAESRKKLLSNIIHAYIGTILFFSALYFQCSVYGDFMDAVNKRDLYCSQVNLKRNHSPDLIIMRVADQRAFKGIKPRFWSGYDYPGFNLLYGPNPNPDSWHNFINNAYEELSIQQIERIANNNSGYTRPFEYQKRNVLDIYIDCFYFSVVCITTVGFGDIFPNLWYTKLFTVLEILIGLSILVVAIGLLFSNWSANQVKEKKTIKIIK